MSRRMPTTLVARLAATLAAIGLSGALHVLAMHVPVEGHRCACRAHDAAHECDCAQCRRASLSAQASDEKLPPCHRAAARKALALQDQGSGARSAPCVEGTCGGPTHTAPLLGASEPFCTRAPESVIAATRPELLVAVNRVRPERALAPETPPPRSA
jgi:hypothetical protein